LTNQATLRDWSVTITVADMAWDVVLTGLASTAATFATQRWG